MTSNLTSQQTLAGDADTSPLSRGEVVLRSADVRLSFGGTMVLDGISVELRRGEVVLLRGDNGSGKTTLLNVLTGSLQPDAGSIEVLSPTSTDRSPFRAAGGRP